MLKLFPLTFVRFADSDHKPFIDAVVSLHLQIQLNYAPICPQSHPFNEPRFARFNRSKGCKKIPE